MNYITTSFNSVDRIGECDLPAFYEAQKTVFDTLAVQALSDQFRLRSKTELSDHLKSGMPMLGIRRAGLIVGTALLSFPDKYKNNSIRNRALKGYPLKSFDPAGITVIQGVGVLPFMRGKGVMRQIFQEATRLSIEDNRFEMVAKVHAGNEDSLSMFRKYGFETYKTGMDGRTGKSVHYMCGDTFNLWIKLQDENLVKKQPKTGLLIRQGHHTI